MGGALLRMLEDRMTTEDISSAPPPIEGQQIKGVVTDFQDVPLTGVRVEAATTGGGDLDQLPVMTDGDGRFAVRGLAEQGRYDLRFILGRVKARTLAVPVGTDQLQVKLARPQGILITLKAPGDQALPDLTHIVLERDTPVKRVREHIGTMLKPRLLLWSIRPGRYVLTVWGGPYLPVQVHGIDVKNTHPAPEIEVMFSAEGASVNGTVNGVNDDGPPAIVSWRRLDEAGHVPRHLTTHEVGSGGQFVVRGLPPGTYRFSAFHPDLGLADTDVTLERAEEHAVAIDLT